MHKLQGAFCLFTPALDQTSIHSAFISGLFSTKYLLVSKYLNIFYISDICMSEKCNLLNSF